MLRVESISYKINNRHLLKDITFSIRKGEMVAILGANGAGKSTLMKILCREKQPSEGRVVFDAKDLNDYSAKELAGKRATLYQQNTVSLAFTVEEIVLMGRYGKETANTNFANQFALKETMEICGISHLADRSMLTLSGGEQQRVHLARVLSQVWDNKDALLLLDEPVSNMDMLYQHQTLAIANALAKKGFMVVCVLHEINLAAQYADRVIMLKGGRKWWDGAPEEVFTSRNIFTAFGVHTQVQTDPRTLITQVVPNGLKFDAAVFNSNLAANYNTRSLKERFVSYRDEYPAKSLGQIAETLGVTEAELLFLGLGENVILLRPEMETILARIEDLGLVKGVTYNEHCKTERIGVYRNFSKEEYTTLFLGEDIDLRIFAGRWKFALAVEEKGKESLQFFDTNGNAVHQIYLTGGSYRQVYLDLVNEFKQKDQSVPVIEKTIRKQMQERRDAEIDISDFHQAWNNMQDTHDFFGLVKRFGLTRMQALRLAPQNRARQVSLESFRRTILQCSNAKIPIMMFTANEGCVQINTGQLANVTSNGEWLTFSELSGGETKLNEDAVHSVWHVVKPTADGDVNSLELYGANGNMVVQFFGERKPGKTELESWKKAVTHNQV
ncbi:heme ABC transporter ATP-binding protein [Flavobacterium pectinovorum]|uniref:heme ABC transporter ATP-binding protein n=1 Tax=Flavobacterium pectinovorum TaxID=29533 RepID=UPI001FAD1A31|nr:heme ABC transporter ATP-binding protein [Flavobacterium pectinovorum]MCI9843386.1 heme ABC transporter ATP-binding protein [Flavobacterium pectinovorum]